MWFSGKQLMFCKVRTIAEYGTKYVIDKADNNQSAQHWLVLLLCSYALTLHHCRLCSKTHTKQ